MLEDSRNDRSGTYWKAGCAEGAMQAGQLRWELQSCPPVAVGFSGAAGFPYSSLLITRHRKAAYTGLQSTMSVFNLVAGTELILSNNGKYSKYRITLLPQVHRRLPAEHIYNYFICLTQHRMQIEEPSGKGHSGTRRMVPKASGPVSINGRINEDSCLEGA